MDDDLSYEDPADLQLRAAMASLKDDLEQPPAGYEDRLWAELERVLWWRAPIRRLAHDRRAQVTAASVGGAVIAAVAIGMMWRRSARRTAAA
ncbi:MAG TPA: hypothetical protein VEA19_05240 [Actinomycetota bacterium]|nr:hypothetical protein [Actinomycetota bacterium]